jgi:hypothetical protein
MDCIGSRSELCIRETRRFKRGLGNAAHAIKAMATAAVPSNSLQYYSVTSTEVLRPAAIADQSPEPTLYLQDPGYSPWFSYPVIWDASNYCLTASIAIVSVTSSPTWGAYLPLSKSLRLIFATALAPHASFFNIGCGMQWNDVTSRRTGLRTPLMVRSSSTELSLSPVKFSLFDV